MTNHCPPDDQRCTARSKSTNEQCKQHAKENGKCRYHGGLSVSGMGTGRPIKTGLGSGFPLPAIASLTHDLAQIVATKDMSEELKAHRALMDRFVQQHTVEVIVKTPDLLFAWLQLLLATAKIVAEQKRPVPAVEAASVAIEDTGYLRIVARATWEAGEQHGIGGATLVAAVEAGIRRILRAATADAVPGSGQLPSGLLALPPAGGGGEGQPTTAKPSKPKRKPKRKRSRPAGATDSVGGVGAGAPADPGVAAE